MFVLVSEFLIKMIAFAVAFYFVLEYVFACEVRNWIGLLGVFIVLGIIAIFYWFVGKDLTEERSKCINSYKKDKR
jgi:hypothetical protein